MALWLWYITPSWSIEGQIARAKNHPTRKVVPLTGKPQVMAHRGDNMVKKLNAF